MRTGYDEPKQFNDHDLGDIIEVCINNSTGKTLEMLESFQEQYEERGSLSPRQREVLLEIVEDKELWDELD